MLDNALFAIEALHAAWMKWATKKKYTPFKDALKAATAKLKEYYQKTAESDAHILTMGSLQYLFNIYLLHSS
jgi:hypothetical protein